MRIEIKTGVSLDVDEALIKRLVLAHVARVLGTPPTPEVQHAKGYSARRWTETELITLRKEFNPTDAMGSALRLSNVLKRRTVQAIYCKGKRISAPINHEV